MLFQINTYDEHIKKQYFVLFIYLFGYLSKMSLTTRRNFPNKQ